MADYIDLYELPGDERYEALIGKIRFAATKSAATLIENNGTKEEVEWAVATLANPRAAAEDIQWYVVAVNSDLSVEDILNASDVLIQSAVNEYVTAVT